MRLIECMDITLNNKVWINPEHVQYIAETPFEQQYDIPTDSKNRTPPIHIVVPKGSYNIGLAGNRLVISKEDAMKLINCGPVPPIYVIDAKQLFEYTP